MSPEDEARVRLIVAEELQRDREDNKIRDVGYDSERRLPRPWKPLFLKSSAGMSLPRRRTMADEEEHPPPTLLMPFVVCASQGGPYDDASFVAGCRFTHIETALETVRRFGVLTFEQYVEPALIPQLDLLAMHLGWTLTAEPWEDHPDEWVLASFVAGEYGTRTE